MKILLLIATLSIASVSIFIGAQKIHVDYQDYLTSSECIRNFVASGIERADIKVIGPKCELKGK